MAFFVLCDDIEQELVNLEKASKLRKSSLCLGIII